MNPCDEFKPLIAGLLDNELTPGEKRIINTHLNRCEACRKEFDEMMEQTGKLKLPPFREPTDTELEQLWKRPYTRLASRAGILMAIGGYVLLMGYGFYSVLLDKGGEPLPKIAVAAMTVGFLTALASVVSNRVRGYKNDKYKGIER